MNVAGPVLIARPEPGRPMPIEPQQAKIALLGVTVQAEVRDVAAHLTLTQVYRNDEERPIEAYHSTANMPAPDALFAQAGIAAPRMRGRMPLAKRASKLGSELMMRRAESTSYGHEQAGTSSVDIWYLALLGTQQPEGWFDGWSIPSAKLGMTVAEAKKRAFSFSADWGFPAALSDQDRERLLVTWLAIRLLAESPEASAASRRAALKARRWLRNALAALGVQASKIEALLAQPPAQRVAELLAQS